MDISLAALLGEDVYNFGELLLHPIVSRAGLAWRGKDAAAEQQGQVHRSAELLLCPIASRAGLSYQSGGVARGSNGRHAALGGSAAPGRDYSQGGREVGAVLCALVGRRGVQLASPSALLTACPPTLPSFACPQIGALKEGGFGWLHEMLECFNSGALTVGLSAGEAIVQQRCCLPCIRTVSHSYVCVTPFRPRSTPPAALPPLSSLQATSMRTTPSACGTRRSSTASPRWWSTSGACGRKSPSCAWEGGGGGVNCTRIQQQRRRCGNDNVRAL